MSFAIVRVIGKDPPGTFLRERSAKIRLGGPDGPIARHVLSLGEADSEWVLEGSALARSLRPAEWPDGADPWILWETADAPPARLIRVLGKSTEFCTELILQLEPLEATADGAWHPCGRLTGEALRLNGGRLTPKAKWTWAAPKMGIGSTTILG